MTSMWSFSCQRQDSIHLRLLSCGEIYYACSTEHTAPQHVQIPEVAHAAYQRGDWCVHVAALVVRQRTAAKCTFIHLCSIQPTRAHIQSQPSYLISSPVSSSPRLLARRPETQNHVASYEFGQNLHSTSYHSSLLFSSNRDACLGAGQPLRAGPGATGGSSEQGSSRCYCIA